MENSPKQIDYFSQYGMIPSVVGSGGGRKTDSCVVSSQQAAQK